MTGGTYADEWRDKINETYTQDTTGSWDDQSWKDEPDKRNAEWHVLERAAKCLQDNTSDTFTGQELDLIRHVMPAHEADHASAKRWVNENFSDV